MCSQITGSLIKNIEEIGGTVRMNAEVTSLIEEDGILVTAEVNGLSHTGTSDLNMGNISACFGISGSSDSPVKTGNDAERVEADYFVANTHPAVALSLITESKLVRNIYRKRINNLENTFGMFTANIALKDNAVPYRNRNIYVYKTGDVWQYADYKPEHVNTCALVSFQVPEDGSSYTRNMDILTPMYWPEVEQWAATTVGRRGDDYKLYKKQKAEVGINLVSAYIPCLKDFDLPEDAIEKIYTSTSLSYRDYTGTPYGSAYGIRKNYEQLMTTLLSPRTPEPNLFLTGQNLNLHGVLGVSMTSFFTCAEIIGMDTVVQGL